MSAGRTIWAVPLAILALSGFAWNERPVDPPTAASEVSLAEAFSLLAPSTNKVIAADTLHSCTLTKAGDAYCWGRGSYGRLGNGSTENQFTPVAVAGDQKFVSIDVGSSHSCGLTEAGEAYCWGNGSQGRLGNGTTVRSLRPRLVVGGHSFGVISLGRRHTCALTTDGSAWCWGVNVNGELGDGTRGSSERRTEPTAVLGGHKYTWLSSGAFHNCGVATDGKTYCWGSGTNGKRGDGTTERATEPVAVDTDVSFAAVFAGRQHTCALTAEGEAWCWGANRSRQLGDGTRVRRETPVQVKTDLRFTSLTLGGAHTCGLTADGKAYCWGSNRAGKLGKGDVGGVAGEPQEVIGVSNFIALDAGNDHTCGMTADDEVYCWGVGELGRLGTGSGADRNAPDRVTGLTVAEATQRSLLGSR